MCQVSWNEAQHELNSLIQKLKTGEESVVYIVRDDNTVAKLTLSEGNSTPVKRLGIGKGRIIDPPNFDQLDKDVQDMFGEAIWTLRVYSLTTNAVSYFLSEMWYGICHRECI